MGGQCIVLGELLSEEIIYDEATGAPLNFNFIDYQLQTMADLRDFNPVLLEVWKGAGEYGACGLGEGVMTRTAAALSVGQARPLVKNDYKLQIAKNLVKRAMMALV